MLAQYWFAVVKLITHLFVPVVLPEFGVRSMGVPSIAFLRVNLIVSTFVLSAEVAITEPASSRLLEAC